MHPINFISLTNSAWYFSIALSTPACPPAAKACSGGRLYLYALAAGGQAGVERAIEKYKSELVRDMKLMGCTKISDLNRNNLRFRR